MGGICSRASSADQSTGVRVSHRNDHVMMNHPDGIPFQNRSSLSKMQYNARTSEALGNSGKTLRDPFAFPETSDGGISQFEEEASEPQLTRSLSQRSKIRTKSATAAKIGASKVSEVGSLLGRAGTVGLGKAVEVLDTLGSSMTNLNMNSGFASGATSKGNKISILSFEVANTIVRGANLMQSLSKENVKYLKEVVLRSEGVERLISSDMNELLSLAAADKREELSIFAGEVMRFGNRCKDPQWHNLGRYFEKLGSELTPQRQLKEEVDTIMQQLMTLVQQTAELYHEMHALDRFDQDYRRKQQEEDNPNAVQRGDSLAILKSELKSQKKHVRNLKKKSLWSRILEEVMEKLVDIVHFLHLEIREAFESGGSLVAGKIESMKNRQILGSAGLALHYANIITQIDTLVARPTSIPPNTRDTLYQGLPPNIKSALRPKLQSFHVSEELTVPQIKAEMEKTLQWLVPIATNTTKAHHGFGWVGEWANTGSEVNRKPSGQADLTCFETLYHADKEKTEDYILELVVWLHHLVSRAKAGLHPGVRSPIKSPIRSPNQKMSPAQLPESNKWEKSITLSQEDHDMLRQVTSRKLTPGISKSQEFGSANKKSKRFYRLTKSSSHSASSGNKKEFLPPPRRHPPFHLFDFNMDKLKALDLIDRVDNIV